MFEDDVKKEASENTEVENENVEANENEAPKEEKASKKEKKDKYKEELAKKDNEIAELKNDLLKNRAELENFKKRMAEQAAKDRKYASQNLVTDIITPMDLLLKACEFETDNVELKNFLFGVQMISKQVVDVLANDGLAEINCVGKEFDPAVAEAIDFEEIEEGTPNMVVAEMSKGYKYKDRVIKVAKVKVTKLKETVEESTDTNEGDN